MLCEFVKREGHALIPPEYQEEDVALGAWVSRQRLLFKQRKLKNDRQRLLETVDGWQWSPHDAAWNAAFALLTQYVQREGHAELPRRHTEEGFDLGYWCYRQRKYNRIGKLPEKNFKLLNDLPGWQWEPLEEKWKFAIQFLEDYIEREGNALVPKDQIESGFLLGNWVSRVRKSFRSGNLPETSIRRLEKLRGWQWFPLSYRWENFYKLLLRYVAREGHANVPDDYIVGKNLLGKWVSNQRRSFQYGTMSLEHRELLECLPGWSWAVHDETWNKNFKILAQYAHREGKTSMPRGYTEKGVALQKWAARQRELYRSGHLSAKCKRLLEGIPGWQWDPFAQKWEENFNVLSCYAEREGHALVPQSYVCGDRSLGNWVSAQRKLFRQGKLPRDRQKRLEEIPGWTWAVGNSQWENFYRLLTVYAAREKNVLVPKKHKEEGFALGLWVIEQRFLFWRNSLPKEHVEQLGQLIGWTWFERERANRRELLSLDDTKLAQEIWRILFGLGMVEKSWALWHMLRVFVDIGVFSKEALSAKGEHEYVVENALYNAIKFGYIDMPKKNFVRAILTEPEDYISEDWSMCLLRVMSGKSMSRVDAIRQAVNWAKTNLGLQINRVTDKSSIWKKIAIEINSAVKENKIELTISNGTEYLTSLE